MSSGMEKKNPKRVVERVMISLTFIFDIYFYEKGDLSLIKT